MHWDTQTGSGARTCAWAVRAQMWHWCGPCKVPDMAICAGTVALRGSRPRCDPCEAAGHDSRAGSSTAGLAQTWCVCTRTSRCLAQVMALVSSEKA